MRRILITGGSGLLGGNWALARAGIDEVVLGLNKRSINLSPATTVDIALDNKELLARQLDEIKPDFVVHAAAITSVEACENNPEAAYAINAGYAGLMAGLCSEANIGFVQISTDHLFDGRQPLLDEQASTCPLNAYGRSKASAENLVLEAHPSALIVRVNFFCWGPQYRSSFSDWIVNALQNGSPVTLYDNVFFTPLYAGQIIDICHQLVDGGATGIYHLSSSDRISKFDFGMRLARVFDLDLSLIARGTYSDDEVARPLDMSLDNRKVRDRLNIVSLPIDASIAMLKEQEYIKLLLSEIDR